MVDFYATQGESCSDQEETVFRKESLRRELSQDMAQDCPAGCRTDAGGVEA